MNINDKLRAWRDTADGGGLPEVRRALYEVLDQFEQHQRATPSPEDSDMTAKHYLDLCATVDAIKGSVEASESAGRKRMDLTVLKEILGA